MSTLRITAPAVKLLDAVALGLLIAPPSVKGRRGMRWGNVVGAAKKNVFAEVLKIRNGEI